MTKRNTLKTGEQVKAEFSFRGASLSDWAKQRGFSRSLVYAIVNGRKKRCARGKSHEIAVLLGMKEGVIERPGRGASR